MIVMVVFLLLIAVQPTQAINVLINRDGSMIFYQDLVLGDEIEESETEKEDEIEEPKTEKEIEKKRFELDRENAKDEMESRRELEKKASEQKREQLKTKNEQLYENAKKLRTVSPQEKQQLRVKNQASETEVMLERKNQEAKKNIEQSQERFKKQERIETERLDIELPTEVELKTENDKTQSIIEERRLRQDKLEIKIKTSTDGTKETELESGLVKAKLKNREFTVDPETNNVTLVTPSGNTHQLIHLPDQALLQMEKAGLLSTDNPLSRSELTVETLEDGTAIYKTKVNKTKRFLGLIPYQVEHEAELKDDTGETSVTPTNTSILNQIRLKLSK